MMAKSAATVGKLWLDALTMTVVPLVFSLLVTGAMGAAEQASGGRTAARAIAWFAGLLVAASLLSALTTPILLDLAPLPTAAFMLPQTVTAMPAVPAASEWLNNIVPTNPIKSEAETAMVPVVIFALLFGLAASKVEDEPRAAVYLVLQGMAQTMLRIVHWVLLIAPLGVFALAFGVGSRLGGSAAGVFAHYVFIVIVAALVSIALVYTVAITFGRSGLIGFARSVLPAQVIAASTQSSLASLPAMIDAAATMHISREDSGIVLPLAVSLFRVTSAAANVAVVIYLSKVHGISIAPMTVVVGAIVAAAVSVAAVGLPAQVSFFAIIAPVCLVMGVPVGLLPLLLAVETLPDIFRTVGNVTGDLAVARIVGAQRNGEKLI